MIPAELIADVEAPSLICECGRKKTEKNVEACADCRFLDGGRWSAQDVIAAFRTVGPRLSVPDIVAITGLRYENCSNVLRRLVRDGRARRVMVESYLLDSKNSRSGVCASNQTYYELVSSSPRVAKAAARSRKRRRKSARKAARA